MVQAVQESPAEVLNSGGWEIDPTHSSVGFVVRHLMITKTRGRFAGLSGRIEIGPTPETSSVEAVIDASSIDTDLEERDQHLRSPDFLDVERFPEIRFRSTKVARLGDDRIQVTGDLTIRDVTKSVVLDGTVAGAVADPWGNRRIAFSATTEIDRDDFGATWNQALETGGFLVGKEVKVELEVEAIRQAAEQAA